MKEQIQKMVYGAIEHNVKQYLPESVPHEEWDMMGLREHYMGWLIGPEDLHFTKSEIEDLEPEHVATELKNMADAIYQAKEAEFTSPIMREVEAGGAAAQRGPGVDGPHRRHGAAAGRQSACVPTPTRTLWWSTASRALTCSTA